MPRSSSRKKQLRELSRAVETRAAAATARALMSDHDFSEDEVDELWLAEYERVKLTRYVDRPQKYRRRKDRWRTLLYDENYLNVVEFHEHFRLDRAVFFRLVNLVKEDPIFLTKGTKPFRGGAVLHMLTLLKYLGTYGNDNSGIKIGVFLGIGSGCVSNYLYRASIAVMKLEQCVLTWPDEAERRMIACRIQHKYQFANCVGITDGTLLPLKFKPQYHGEDYYSGKASYLVNALVTCDDVARVRDLVVGWPGSVHDNRVWANSPMVLQPEAHFTPKQYVLGDSAFQVSKVMIPAFKNPPKAKCNGKNDTSIQNARRLGSKASIVSVS